MTASTPGPLGRWSDGRLAASTRWLAARLEGVDPAFTHDVALTVAEVGATRGRRAHLGELGSLAALALRLRARARAGPGLFGVWRGGLYLGAVMLLVVMTVDVWTAQFGGATPRVTPALLIGPAPGWWTAVAGVTGAVGVGLGYSGRRAGALTATALTALVTLTASLTAANSGGYGDLGWLSGLGVVFLGLLLGRPAQRPPVAAGPSARCWPRSARRAGVAAAYAAGPLLALAATCTAGEAAPVALRLGLTVLLPALCVLLGGQDPRLAAAAAVVWFGRLALGALGELGDALRAVALDRDGLLLLRWLLMAAGVAIAVAVTGSGSRRLTELH
ncbi:hypothetical protein MXD62_33075 [Frankia sp. Mgl5]|uniref:hypothetical protein n=1 Tax=Frankia sp. Mgl5 TaxID=2933793 RepID=UPI00200F73B6|nr:hypothetical protein [Frankia sp. Mgl5]MCK9931915.1 hypothetical protein [Frankia sp. Mgl5]